MQCEFCVVVTSEGPSRFESNKTKMTSTKLIGVKIVNYPTSYFVVHLENARDNYLKE